MRIVRFGEELNEDNQEHFIKDFRRVVLPIIVIEPGGTIHPIGTCFIISCTGKEAIALTAKHNIEYIMKVDGARSLYHSSTPEEFQVYYFPSKPVNIKMFVAYLAPNDKMVPCDLVKAWFLSKGPDIAIILLRIPDGHQEIFTHRMKIDSKGPIPHYNVHTYGYLEMKTSGHRTDSQDIILEQKLALPLKHIPCKVEKCYSFGEHRLVKWPCFQVNANFDSGMSGGPIVYIKNEEMIACGVVTLSSSFAEEGIGSKIYPVLITKVDASFPFLSSNHPSLIECIKHKMILDVGEAHKHVLSDGRWTDTELTDMTLDFGNNDLKEVGFMVNVGSSIAQEQFTWLSEECLYLGRINQKNGDDANYFLISRDFHNALIAIEEVGIKPNIQYISAQKPYIWLGISDQIFRFFVLELFLPDDISPIKVLTDAHLNAGLPKSHKNVD